MLDDGERIGDTLWYRTELCDDGDHRRMSRGYLTLLECAAANPDRPLGCFPLPV